MTQTRTDHDCFAYAPGPGWPSSLIYPLMDAKGNAPTSTAIDVDPTQTTVSDYVSAVGKCRAVLAYREDISDVAQGRRSICGIREGR